MEDNGVAGVNAGVNGGVLSAQLPHFPAPCFKGSFKTTSVHFKLHKLRCLTKRVNPNLHKTKPCT